MKSFKSRFIEMFGTVENSHFEYTDVQNSCEILDSQRVPITAKDRVPGPYPYYGANGVQDYVADYIFDDDLVLLAEDGGHFDEVGRVAYLVSGKCWVNNHAHILKPKSCLNIHYLLHCLNLTNLSMEVNGTTRQKLTQAAMRKIKLPLPPIELQNQFADVVKQVDKSKLIFQQMVSKFDELVKSRFIEMFGHPLQNEKLFEESRLSDICHVITDGSHYSPDDSQDSDIPMLSVKDMRENSFDYSACKHVNEETYNELVKNGCEPQINDVLISKDGSYFKYGFVVTDYKRQCLLSSIAIIRPVLDKINPNYLRHYLLSDAVVEYVGSNCISGTALKRVILKEIRKINVIVPPIELQNQFADFVKQVDKSKFIISKMSDLVGLASSIRF